MTAEAATQTFDNIAPVVARHAAASIRCPDLQGIAISLAWYYWHRSQDKHTLPASVWARVGVRHALAGRDLPGIRPSCRDAMRFLETQGAGMNDLADRRPGPARQAIARESSERFWESLSEYERQICELLGEGVPNHEVARRMSRTPGAISQRRRQLMENYVGQ